MTTMQTLIAKATEADTATLTGALVVLDAKGNLDESERMTYAAICEAIETRHNLSAALDDIFTVDFAGTYADALLIALAAS